MSGSSVVHHQPVYINIIYAAISLSPMFSPTCSLWCKQTLESLYLSLILNPRNISVIFATFIYCPLSKRPYSGTPTKRQRTVNKGSRVKDVEIPFVSEEDRQDEERAYQRDSTDQTFWRQR